MAAPLSLFASFIFILLIESIISSTSGSLIPNPYSNNQPGQPRKLTTEDKLERLKLAAGDKKPNFIIFFADDLGYGDLSYNGHPTIYTPNIDYYALSGIRLTTWYSGFHVCSPSRASMLTGRLCVRSGTCGPWSGDTFGPGAIGGLPTNETTFAKILKQVGYNTKAIGKWVCCLDHFHILCNISIHKQHLGVLPQFMPVGHGFDEYLG